MRQKFLAIFVLLIFLSCHAKEKADSSMSPDGQNAQDIINPNLPTVTLEKVQPMKLHSVLRYGAYIKPKAYYPVLQVVDAVIRSIPVTVGTFVKEGDLLYSFQQVLPGTSFGIGWIQAKNTGYISLIKGVEGHTIKKDELVLVISDFTSVQLSFYLSNQDVGRVKNGQEVYFAEYIDELDKINQRLRLHLNEETQQSLMQQKEEIEKLMQETKGKIIRMPIAPEGDLGVFNVQVDFPVHESLKIGRFVIIEMHVDPYEGLAVRQSNLQRRYGKYQVTVVNNNIVDYKEVEIGRTYGDMVVIKSGLEAGDEIVVATNRYVRPGVKVNVRRRGPKKSEGKGAPKQKADSPQQSEVPQKEKQEALGEKDAAKKQGPIWLLWLEQKLPAAQKEEQQKKEQKTMPAAREKGAQAAQAEAKTGTEKPQENNAAKEEKPADSPQQKEQPQQNEKQEQENIQPPQAAAQEDKNAQAAQAEVKTNTEKQEAEKKASAKEEKPAKEKKEKAKTKEKEKKTDTVKEEG